MTRFYARDGVCFCPAGGRLPEGAESVSAPFAPLVFLTDRPGARGIYAFREPSELDEAEGPGLLLPPAPAAFRFPEAEKIVRESGACALNTAYANAFAVLVRFLRPKRDALRVSLVGLGDVGGTVLTGLVLLGREISEIGIYDPFEPLVSRYELEMNQVLPPEDGRVMPRVVRREPSDLFHCDVLIFTASRGVPPVGSGVRDVRMAQYEANRAMLAPYAARARETGFTGLFAQVSDPVDHLAHAVFAASNLGPDGAPDGGGLLPEQVRGYGLGVMRARARYFAREMGLDPDAAAVFGPHGQGLVAANDEGDGYDEALSLALTEKTVRANLLVRDLGFKPYLAPGLSSAAVSILRTLRGEWHDDAGCFGGVHFGCRSRMTPLGPELRRAPLHPALFARVEKAWRALEETER